VAEVTLLYRWGPADAWGLPVSELQWWRDQYDRLTT
jgi:hypothetical protein